jgi:uncharacterized protein
MLYLDASALAKLYITEPRGSEMPGVIGGHRDAVFTSIVTYAETLSVLARSMRERRISPREYHVTKKAFLADWPAWHVIEVTQTVLAPAAGLIERHAIRGFDAVHLSSALWVGNPTFACFDARLRKAAVAEGLVVVPG